MFEARPPAQGWPSVPIAKDGEKGPPADGQGVMVTGCHEIRC